MDNQTALITAEECLIRVFFGYKPYWNKYLYRSTGLQSDQSSQQKFWTGLGFQKSPICSTLLVMDPVIRSRLRQDSTFLVRTRVRPAVKFCEKPDQDSQTLLILCSSWSLCGHFK